jgi:hypothetical protein
MLVRITNFIGYALLALLAAGIAWAATITIFTTRYYLSK